MFGDTTWIGHAVLTHLPADLRNAIHPEYTFSNFSLALAVLAGTITQGKGLSIGYFVVSVEGIRDTGTAGMTSPASRRSSLGVLFMP